MEDKIKTIAELMQFKKETEDKITAILNDFELKTGFQPSGITSTYAPKGVASRTLMFVKLDFDIQSYESQNRKG